MRQFFKSLIPETLIIKYKSYRLWQFHKQIEGNNVFCPICKSHFKYFASYGLIVRKNARCHNCNSLERHRLLYLYLKEKLQFFSSNNNLRILHFAPEYSFYKIFSQMNNIDYVPCDLAPELYNYKGNTKISRVDITKISFDENTFDFIICNQILEHVPNDKIAMKELFRVLKKGGAGIFQVPIDYNREKTYEDFSITLPEEREKAFGQHDHVRWYGRDYFKKLEKVGFIVTVDDYVKSFSPKDLFKYSLIPTEMIYHCRKQILL